MQTFICFPIAQNPSAKIYSLPYENMKERDLQINLKSKKWPSF